MASAERRQAGEKPRPPQRRPGTPRLGQRTRKHDHRQTRGNRSLDRAPGARALPPAPGDEGDQPRARAGLGNEGNHGLAAGLEAHAQRNPEAPTGQPAHGSAQQRDAENLTHSRPAPGALDERQAALGNRPLLRDEGGKDLGLGGRTLGKQSTKNKLITADRTAHGHTTAGAQHRLDDLSDESPITPLGNQRTRTGESNERRHSTPPTEKMTEKPRPTGRSQLFIGSSRGPQKSTRRAACKKLGLGARVGAYGLWLEFLVYGSSPFYPSFLQSPRQARSLGSGGACEGFLVGLSLAGGGFIYIWMLGPGPATPYHCPACLAFLGWLLYWSKLAGYGDWHRPYRRGAAGRKPPAAVGHVSARGDQALFLF